MAVAAGRPGGDALVDEKTQVDLSPPGALPPVQDKAGRETIQTGTVVFGSGEEKFAKRYLMAVQVKVIAGPHAGEMREVGAGHDLIVGRCPPADWQLANETRLSRRHFQLNVHPDHARVIDLQSTNGTVLNGKKVAEMDLEDGDRIQCGNTIFSMRLVFSTTEPDTGSTVEF